MQKNLVHILHVYTYIKMGAYISSQKLI